MALKEIRLPYGKSQIIFRIQERNLGNIITPKILKKTDEKRLIKDALANPIGSPPLRKIARAGDKVAILIDDNTRKTPVKKILPFVFSELNLSGVNADNVLLLIAGGTHRPMTDAEIKDKVGERIKRRYRILNHNWKDEKNLVKIGFSKTGFPIEVNRLAVEADVCMGIGDICPHPLCGWSGGGKIIEPGICGARTTNCVHAYAIEFPEYSIAGVYDNPIRKEMDDIGKKAGLKFIINTVLDGEEKIAGVFAGDSISAHRKGVKFAGSIWIQEIDALADIVIASSYPADIDFWQAQKTLLLMAKAVRRGGDLILVTPCPEGLSAETKHKRVLAKYCCYPSKEIRRIALKQGEDDLAGLAAAVGTSMPNEIADITIVSHGLGRKECASMGVNYAETIDDALQRCFKKNGKDANVSVMTHGPKVVPVLKV